MTILFFNIYSCTVNKFVISSGVEFDNSYHRLTLKETIKVAEKEGDLFVFELNNGGVISIQFTKTNPDSVHLIKQKYFVSYYDQINTLQQKHHCMSVGDDRVEYENYLIEYNKIGCSDLEYDEFYLCSNMQYESLCLVHIYTNSIKDKYTFKDVYSVLDRIKIIPAE